MRLLGSLLLSLPVLLLLGAPSAPAQPRTTSGTAALNANGEVRVDNHEGRITIDTWDRNEVRYEAVVRPEDGAEHPEATVVEVDRSNRRFVIETEYDEDKGGSGGGLFGLFGGGQNIMPVEHTLTVPRTARVEIDDHESNIEVTGLRAALVVDTHDGPVRVADQSGGTELDSHDGDLRVDGLSGPLLMDTHDSEVRLSDVEGAVTVDSHDGDLVADGLRGGLTVDTHDGDGRVEFAALTGDLQIDTHDGDFTITLPAGAGCELATNFDDDASLRADFDLAPYRMASDDDDDEVNYQGSVNGGGPRVRLTAHDGSFELRTR